MEGYFPGTLIEMEVGEVLEDKVDFRIIRLANKKLTNRQKG
jgi:hypothetical protein